MREEIKQAIENELEMRITYGLDDLEDPSELVLIKAEATTGSSEALISVKYGQVSAELVEGHWHDHGEGYAEYLADYHPLALTPQLEAMLLESVAQSQWEAYDYDRCN
jgi:hypothetical protein